MVQAEITLHIDTHGPIVLTTLLGRKIQLIQHYLDGRSLKFRAEFNVPQINWLIQCLSDGPPARNEYFNEKRDIHFKWIKSRNHISIRFSFGSTNFEMSGKYAPLLQNALTSLNVMNRQIEMI